MTKTESFVGTWTDIGTAVSVPESGGIGVLVLIGAMLLISWTCMREKS